MSEYWQGVLVGVLVPFALVGVLGIWIAVTVARKRQNPLGSIAALAAARAKARAANGTESCEHGNVKAACVTCAEEAQKKAAGS